MNMEKNTHLNNIKEELEFLQDLIPDTTGMSEAEVDKFWRKHLKRRIRTPCNEETLLLAFCLEHQQEIPEIVGYPLVIKYEYELVPGRSDCGKGDLVLSDGKENYLIVEAKYLTLKTGRNPRNANREKRNYAEKQKERNLRDFRWKHPEVTAQGYILTNKKLSEELQKVFEEYRQEYELSWKK